MSIGEICETVVVTTTEDADLVQAAELMRQKHVGYLVVAQPLHGTRELGPCGVLTDRDIVVAVIAKGLDPKTLRVGDVMTPLPVVIDADASVSDTLGEMRRLGVRRLPVTSNRGELVGVVSIDDILRSLVENLGLLSDVMRTEISVEQIVRVG